MEKNELFLESKLEIWVAKMKKAVSVLNAQNESLFKKHKGLERLLLPVEKVKTPTFKEKKWFLVFVKVYRPVNNCSVMSGRSHRFLGITSTFSEVNVSCSRT